MSKLQEAVFSREVSPDEAAQALRGERDLDSLLVRGLLRMSVEHWKEVIDRYRDYRKYVPYLRTPPPEVLHYLAIAWGVRDAELRALASVRRLLPETMNLLAGHKEPSVRLTLAYNRKLPKALLVALSEDADEEVREAARLNLQRRKG